MLADINMFLSYPIFWFLTGGIILIVTFSIDMLDHGIFIGLPTMIMAPIAPWVDSWFLILAIYIALMLIFYQFCNKHRDWLHGNKMDVNDD